MRKVALLAVAAAALAVPVHAADTEVLDNPVDPFEQVVREIEHTVICDWIDLQVEKRRTTIVPVAHVTHEERFFLFVWLVQQQEECGIDNTAEIDGLNGGIDEVSLPLGDG